MLFDDPTRVSPLVAPLLREMLLDRRPAYAWAAREALEALASGALAGIQTSSARFWICLHEPRARPARAERGALFQCLEPRGSGGRGGDRDRAGWIVVQDGYDGGALVLVHELGHFVHRDAIARLAPEGAVRARLLGEIGARHLAFLAETGADPGARPLPAPGALFACAVKIASYPEVYGDDGTVSPLLGGDDGPLRDLVGRWFIGLGGLPFFERGSSRSEAHAAWLGREIDLASAGRSAPRVPAEGTL